MTHFRTIVYILTLCFAVSLIQPLPTSALSLGESEIPHLCPDAEIYVEYPVSTVDERIANVEQFASRLEIRNNATESEGDPNATSATFGFASGALPRDAALIGIDTYGIQAERAYTVDFFVYYVEGPLTLNLRYLAFLNEQQIDISEDVQTQYQPLTVPPGTAQTFYFDLPPLIPGIHDLILVGIPTDIDNLFATDSIALTDTRISLIVGDELTAGIPPRAFTRIETDPENDSFYHELDLYRDGQPSSYRDTGAVMSPGSPFGIDVRLGWMDPRPYVPEEQQLPSLDGTATLLSSSESPVQTALILIRNYEQVDFDDNNRVRYLELPPDLLYTDIPIPLMAANSIANEDIVVMRVNSPGMPRCLLSPGLNLSAMPSISIKRTVINIEQE